MKKRRKPQPDPLKPVRGLSGMLESPQGLFSSPLQIDIEGNREAVVDGCKGVLEYNDCRIRLQTGKMIVQFTGHDLQIRSMTEKQAVIQGYITALEYISI